VKQGEGDEMRGGKGKRGKSDLKLRLGSFGIGLLRATGVRRDERDDGERR
jgi:hypothetical protein